MKYFEADWEKSVLSVYDVKGKLLMKKSLAEELTEEESVGIICSGMANGKSVRDLATGQGGRLSEGRFYILVEGSNLYRNMYISAMKRRLNYYIETLVNLKEASEIKAREALIKSYASALESVLVSAEKFDKVEFNALVTEDKLKELTDRGEREKLLEKRF